MNKNTEFSHRILAWFDRHGRKHLPWQQQPTAYRVWVSEIMLQQTQVTTVIPYYEKFILRFPEISDLARADIDEVLHYWTGLGYYARARHLHQAAQQIQQQYNGIFPDAWSSVVALPGIGRSTAGAILALAYGQRYAILDGNVKRVLCRYHAIIGDSSTKAVSQQLWALAEDYTPNERVADYTQAMMDLGALVCRRRGALCGDCPLCDNCQAYAQQAVDRYPQAKARKITPEVRLILLLILDPTQRVLLQKRSENGIWGGLWSLPEVSEISTISDWCQQHLNHTPISWTEWPPLRHQLTHLLLNIYPVLIMLPAPIPLPASTLFHWYDLQSPSSLGLPTPVVNLLEQARGVWFKLV